MTIFNVQPRPNIGAALGQGLLQGWEQQGNVNMQVKLNDMLEKKEQAKNYQGNKAIATAFGLPEIAEGSGSVSNAQFLDTMKYLKTSGQLDRIRSNRIAMMGQQELGSPIATGQENVQRPTTQQMTKQQKNLPFALPTTEAPSVIQQQPKVNQVPIVASTQPQQITPTPKRSFEEKKADIDNRFRNIYDSAQSGAEKDAAIKDRNAEMSRLINEEKLGETKRAGDIKEKQFEMAKEKDRREIEKPAKEYIENLNSRLDKARDSIGALRTIQELSKKEGHGAVNNFINRFWKFLGNDPSLIANRDEEAILKLSNDLMPAQVSQYTGQGARVFVNEVNSLALTIPNLLQTKEGRIDVAKYFELKNNLVENEFEAMKEMRVLYKKTGRLLDDDFKADVMEKTHEKNLITLEKMHQIMSPGSPPLRSLDNAVIVKDPKSGRLATIDPQDLDKALAKGYIKQ